MAQIQNYRHNWSERDYIILFTVCSLYTDDAGRVNKLLEIFPNNRANGLRMMIEKNDYLSGDNNVRRFFREGNISRRMRAAWEIFTEYNV